MTMPKWFEPKITLGAVLQIGVILATVITAWNTIVSDVRTNAGEISRLDTRVTAQEVKLERLLGDIQMDRLAQTSLLTEMRTDVRYLRAAVDEIKSRP
jgi:hypothetical protein